MTNRSFTALQAAAAQVQDLAAAMSLLSWDQETYMPAGAIEARAGQLATLSGIHHRMLATELMPLAEALLQESGLSETERLNVEQLHRQLTRTLKLPEDLVQSLAAATAQAQHAWEQARAANSFAQFAPHLQHILELKQQEAECYGYAAERYDALLDAYEPGMTAAQLDVLFGDLQTALVPFLQKVQGCTQVDDSFLYQAIPQDAQWAFGLELLDKLGYDRKHGRQDISAHPFSIGIHPTDVRITTVVKEKDLTAMVYSTIHEFGHAYYELGLPAAFRGLPQGEACSLSIHESQSRIWENNLGRSLPFVQHWHRRMAGLYPDGLAGKDATQVFRALNRIAPSPIRIYADEVTYHLHIILRYRLERQLVAGTLAVADLPEAWNSTLKELLGIVPASDAEGVLQDVHWSIGALGYFPTYSLGSLYAAQFWAHASQAMPALEADIAAGNYEGFRQWLRTHIHSQGRLYDSETLCRRVTGEGLNAEYFLSYIERKFATVYDYPL
ncbi:MAG: carboxypeptidase M32 [Bacteroidetes bacterium]|nr:carboxypeptidase M32 [Bacteroidota bacterium]